MMKERVICLLLLCLFVLPGTAFATNWVKVPGVVDFHVATYFDADSVTKEDNILNYWSLLVCKGDSCGIENGVPLKYWLHKVQVDLRAPRKAREVIRVYFDQNDRQYGDPKYNPNSNWRSSDLAFYDLLLAYAKDGPDSDTIPSHNLDGY